MKNILKSLLIVVAVAAVAGGATWAYFTAQDTITGNTLGTATVKIDAKGEANSTTPSKPITVTNLVPGQWSGYERGGVYNQSTVAVNLWMYVDNVTGDACEKVNLTVTTGHAGTDAGERAVVLYNASLMGLAGVGNKIVMNTAASPFPNGVPANWTQVMQQKVQLDPSADNSYQNKTCSWTEVFYAENVAPAS